ncbi:MAG: hypothetical protein K6F44_02625 [Lachnospiraceae bacterium]|jgi:glucose-6-phosphate 1-dehydrogenase|nr:hypothetical protein [Lachnospiraceae bacterium]
MIFSEHDYNDLKHDLETWKNAKQILLPQAEYAEVMSELNTHLSTEDRKRLLITKPIGNYYYTFLNKGFNDYIIVGKHHIISDIESEWRETDDNNGKNFNE